MLRKTYTEDWLVISYRTRAAASWRCSECGADKSLARNELHVHHRNQNPQDNNPNNLIVLCKGCHDTAHERLHQRYSDVIKASAWGK